VMCSVGFLPFPAPAAEGITLPILFGLCHLCRRRHVQRTQVVSMPCSLPSTSCDSPILLPQTWMLQLGFTGKKAGAVKGASKATNETAVSTPIDAAVHNGPSASTSKGAQKVQDSAPDGQQKVCLPQQAFLRLQRRHAASQQNPRCGHNAVLLCACTLSSAAQC
jgi:hypothetical protein